MGLIWTLFILQTLLLCASAYVGEYISIEVGSINIFETVNSFRVHRLHQIINIIFLVSTGFSHRKRVQNMLRYFSTRQSAKTYLLWALYLFLLVTYLEVVPNKYLYQYCIFPFIAFSITFFPYLFPEGFTANPVGFKEDDYNFALLGKGGQVLPVASPQTSIFIAGTQGSGKTKSVVEPVLAQMLYKGYAGILYDYDFSPLPSKDYSLTHLVHRCLEEFSHRKAVKSRLVSINFQDLTTSSRFNPIDPAFIEDRLNLATYLETFLLNLNPEEAQKKDFWYKNTYVFLKSVIVFLANKYPSYCTLPHAFLLGLQPHESLMKLLKTDEEAMFGASAAIDAFDGSPEQFTGVITSFKILLEKLIDKKFCWILSANEVPVIVNDATHPLVVCLGNTPTHTSFASPILVMIAAVLLGNMYAHGRNKSFLAIDELPAFRLPNLSQVPTTARKYGISTMVALQDMAQLEDSYTNIKAKVIQNTFGNYFLGRSSLQGANYISELMGKKEIEVSSTTKSAGKVSQTTQQKEVPIITPQEAMSLRTGEFVGKVVHPSGGFFKMQLEPVTAYHKRLGYQYMQPLPITREQIDIEDNFRKIQEEVRRIIS